jgi:hypothetical protein
MTIKRNIPSWCRIHYSNNSNGDNTKRCCQCGKHEIEEQQGDGKVIHSICYSCKKRLFLNKINKEMTIKKGEGK